jgi:hypothetical protein
MRAVRIALSGESRHRGRAPGRTTMKNDQCSPLGLEIQSSQGGAICSDVWSEWLCNLVGGAGAPHKTVPRVALLKTGHSGRSGFQIFEYEEKGAWRLDQSQAASHARFQSRHIRPIPNPASFFWRTHVVPSRQVGAGRIADHRHTFQFASRKRRPRSCTIRLGAMSPRGGSGRNSVCTDLFCSFNSRKPDVITLPQACQHLLRRTLANLFLYLQCSVPFIHLQRYVPTHNNVSAGIATVITPEISNNLLIPSLERYPQPASRSCSTPATEARVRPGWSCSRAVAECYMGLNLQSYRELSLNSPWSLNPNSPLSFANPGGGACARIAYKPLRPSHKDRF